MEEEIFCPKCGSDEYTMGKWEDWFNKDELVIPCVCKECGKVFHQLWEFSKIISDEEGK